VYNEKTKNTKEGKTAMASAKSTGRGFIRFALLLLAASLLLLGEDKMALTITSPAFSEGGAIPARYTCEGEDVSPPLHWDGVEANVRSLVLIVDDPDAPDPKAPKRTWVHWVLYNLPAQSRGLDEAAAPAELPAGTQEGMNDFQRGAYGGPCPPIGRHRYFFKLYALDTPLAFAHAPTKAEVEAAMQGHVLQSAALIGTYEKR
jgi:Raf kinase inhibitor-like YbhB/YbcL family protein